ncbi:SUKH-4 family immunity protein [Kitasatospora sp. NPDC059571]|uniref:SUKH-4 family immunity protein n=1 Tax=Kitasatospora sp. NPDC059571 TaxID=3346871 RepID=UPI0036BE5A7C
MSRLRFAAQAWGDEDLVALLDGLGLPLPWRADWARWRPLEAFDPRAFAPGWTGPVEFAAVRPGENGAGTGAVCLRSCYDGLHRWYELSSGARTGEAEAAAPDGAWPAPETATGSDGVPALEVLADFDLLKVRIGGPGSTRVHALCTPYPGAQAYPLADGRLLLAGHSGAAVVSFDPTAPATASQPRATEANLLPPEDWWTGERREAGDLTRYYHGGAVRADPERLGAAGSRPEVADLLGTVGLPAFPVFWQRTADCLADPRTLADHVAEEGGNAPSDGAGLTVLAVSADDETPLCVEHATGRVVQAETSEPDLVNTSVAAFAACQALTSWALSVSAARQVPERYAFLDFLRAALARIDPEAAADQGSDWWWYQAVQDETSYTLYA